jgi:heat shock protein HslJ
MRFTLVIAALVAAACASQASKEPPPKPFTGTRWLLVMDIPHAGDKPYVRFGDGLVEGFGGCSRFNGRYVQDTVGSRFIAIGRLQVDKRLCDARDAAAESRMLEVLQAVSSYSITADAMSMTGSGGTLRFVAAGAPATPASQSGASSKSLAGTRWRGEVEAGVDEASVPWLEFADGRVAGYTGCNMLSGPWREENGEIHLGPLVTTKRACAGPGGEVERRVLAAFGERSRVSREGARLVASPPGGERFEFSEVR